MSSTFINDELGARLRERPILVDARKILDGGIGVYTQNLLSDLCIRGTPVAALGERGVLEQFPWVSAIRIVEESAARYSRDELFGISRRVDFRQFSLFHTPHYMLPFGIQIPTVVTVHDLIHLTHPEKIFYPPAAWLLIASALIRARAVVTVSAAVKRDIDRVFPFIRSKNRVMHIPNRLADSFREDLPAFAPENCIFFSVSQLKPHKGIFDLLRAFIDAKEKLEALVARAAAPRSALETELRIAGFGSERLAADREFKRIVGERSDVSILGPISPKELKDQYSRAKAVAVPSRAEGFGFPVIEAHAQGAPCLMRPVPALLELRQIGDFVAEDFSPDALARALLQVLCQPLGDNPTQRAELHASALSYSSDRFIEPLLALYEKLVIS